MIDHNAQPQEDLGLIERFREQASQLGQFAVDQLEGHPRLAAVGSAIVFATGGGLTIASMEHGTESASANSNIPAANISQAYQTKRARINPQNVMDRIHTVLQPLAGDSVQNDNCHLGGAGAPNIPCRNDKITPTTAFLEPSEGGFTTSCNNRYISTYKYYKITPNGQAFKTCGPLGVWPKKSREGQFQGSLNRIGNTIKNSVKLDLGQTTESIRANRSKVTVKYECPDPSAATDSKTRKIVLVNTKSRSTGKYRKLSTATSYPC